MTLTEIANKHNCDKGTVAYEAHGYTEIYQNYIPAGKSFNLLEIGIWHGDSLRMWKEYNPEIRVTGIDIDRSVFNYIKPEEGFTIHIGNQSDYIFLQSIVDHTLFEAIIDDGSHVHNDILSSFMFLYPHLDKHGYYFIEDLHASTVNRNLLIRQLKMYKMKKMELINDKLLIIQK